MELERAHPRHWLSCAPAWRESRSSTRTGTWDKTSSGNIWCSMPVAEKLPFLVCFRSSEILGRTTNSEMGHAKGEAGCTRHLQRPVSIASGICISNQSEAGKTKKEQVLTITIKKLAGKIRVSNTDKNVPNREQQLRIETAPELLGACRIYKADRMPRTSQSWEVFDKYNDTLPGRH